jgi:hypothetical protein
VAETSGAEAVSVKSAEEGCTVLLSETRIVGVPPMTVKAAVTGRAEVPCTGLDPMTVNTAGAGWMSLCCVTTTAGAEPVTAIAAAAARILFPTEWLGLPSEMHGSGAGADH